MTNGRDTQSLPLPPVRISEVEISQSYRQFPGDRDIKGSLAADIYYCRFLPLSAVSHAPDAEEAGSKVLAVDLQQWYPVILRESSTQTALGSGNGSGDKHLPGSRIIRVLIFPESWFPPKASMRAICRSDAVATVIQR